MWSKSWSVPIPPFAALLVFLVAPFYLAPVNAAIGARVPISAETATAIAASAFPLTIAMERGKLFLTEPNVLFSDVKTISLRVRVHAYDHRPSEGIALSEMGYAVVTAMPDYKPETKKILLKNPQLKQLVFDRDVPAAVDFSAVVHKSWAARVTNPISADVPSHAYIEAIKSNIYDMNYDGDNIYLEIRY